MAKQSSNDSHAVEGEIIDNDKSEETFGASTERQEDPAVASPRRTASFYIALILFFFVAGLSAYPWLAVSINSLFPALLPYSAQQDSLSADRLDALESDIATNRAALSTLEGDVSTLNRARDIDADGLTALDEQISSLRAAFEQISGSISSSVAQGQQESSEAEIAIIYDRLANIETQLEELSNTTSSAPSGAVESSTANSTTPGAIMSTDTPAEALFTPRTLARINDLDQRLVRVESQISEAMVANPQIKLFPIAAARLARLVEQSQPFRAALQEVEVLVATLPPFQQRHAFRALQTLDQSSTHGILSLESLKDQFSPLAARALSPALQSQEPGFFESIWLGLKGLVSVRRTGDLEGETDEAIIARAEARLMTNDLTGALDAINLLTSPAATVFEDWREAASTRLGALAATEALMVVALNEKNDVLREQ